MKKNMMVIFGLLAGFMLTAAEQNQFITFSTKGPDKYADGETVKDGECYALVKVPTGKIFAGFLANGKEVDDTTGKIVLTAPIAKGGRCPTVMFQVDEANTAAKTAGSWEVYLLDTRVVHGGKVTLAGVGADGYAKVVNGAGLAVSTADQSSAQVAGSVVGASGEKRLPEGVATPEIKSIKVEGGKVYVTVRGATAPFVRYSLASSTDAAGEFVPETQQENGGAEELVFVTEQVGGTQVLKVVGE